MTLPSVLTRRGTAVLVAAAASLAAFVGTAAPAHAAAYATVGNTGGTGLTVRQSPTPSSASLGVVQTGTQVSISCQAYGTSVTNESGFSSTLWDFVPARGGYLADAYMNTGYDARIPGIPLCGGTTTPPPTGTYVPIQQNQGQYTQWEDCGPTSVVTALLRLGRTPHGYSSGYREAIERAREDMGLARGVKTGGTNTWQVVTAYSSYGISAWVSNNFDTILAQVRSGRPAVMAGNTRTLPWGTNVANPTVGVAHFLDVAGYDSASGQYLVLDPIATSNTVKYASRATLLDFFSGYGGGEAVLV